MYWGNTVSPEIATSGVEEAALVAKPDATVPVTMDTCYEIACKRALVLLIYSQKFILLSCIFGRTCSLALDNGGKLLIHMCFIGGMRVAQRRPNF